MAAPTQDFDWPSKKIGLAGILLFVGILWSTLALAADGYIAWSAYWQIRAVDYATTSGVITRSAVEEHHGTRNGTPTTYYTANIKYSYSVAGTTYTGDRYRYGEGLANDGMAHRIIGENPVGKRVTVYYHLGNPADSLLHPGLEGFDLFVGMCLLPFNLVPLGILAMAGRRLWSRCFGYRAAGAQMWDDGFVVRVRLPSVPPINFAALTAGALAFLAMFPILFYYGGLHPPKSLMYRVWPVVLGGATLAYAAAVWRLSRGGFDLVIDTTAGRITLPRTTVRKFKIMRSLRGLTSIEVRTVGLPGSRGGMLAGYCPTAVFTDANGIRKAETLVQWGDPRRAEALAAWLRQRLNVAGPKGDPVQG